VYLSKVYKKIHKARKDGFFFVINQGGTSSTKTFSTLQFILSIARNNLDKGLTFDIAGGTMPDLKRGILRDMPIVCDGFGINFDLCFNKVESAFRCYGNTINFIAIDKIGKSKGSRRDYLFLNEADNIAQPIAEQLMARTKKGVFIDFNPTARFWAHDIAEDDARATLIKSTYKDNEVLDQSIVEYIESKMSDKNWFRVYGLGEIGYAEGLIFSNWEIENFDKESFGQYRHGLDWGFSQDPFAYNRLAIDKTRKTIHICDELHGTGMLNSQSAPLVSTIADRDIVWCDSAEPKSVAEYKSLGVNARSVKKGQGSIESGIKHMNEYKIIIHPSCVETIKEFQTYRWREDKLGGFMPKPEDSNNHHMDALRYALEDDMKFNKTRILVTERFLP